MKGQVCSAKGQGHVKTPAKIPVGDSLQKHWAAAKYLLGVWSENYETIMTVDFFLNLLFVCFWHKLVSDKLEGNSAMNLMMIGTAVQHNLRCNSANLRIEP